MAEYGLSGYDADVLVAERESAEFFEAIVRRPRDGRDPKIAANWIINELFGRLNREGAEIAASPVSAEQLGGILDLIAEETISGKIAKDVFEIIWSEGGNPREIVETREHNKWLFRPPGGETYEEVARRVGAWHATLNRDTVVTAHGGTARALIAFLGVAAPDEAVHHTIDQGVVYVFADRSVTKYE